LISAIQSAPTAREWGGAFSANGASHDSLGFQPQERDTHNHQERQRCVPWGGAISANGASHDSLGFQPQEHHAHNHHTLTEAAVEQLKSKFGGKPNSLVIALEDFRLKLAGTALGEAPRMETLAFLDRKLAFIHCRMERCEEDEAAEEEAKQAPAILP